MSTADRGRLVLREQGARRGVPASRASGAPTSISSGSSPHGGVHSHIDHLRALLELAEREGMAERTWIHAFTDGRDVSPHSAVHDLAELPVERIATVCGRYYAMDRDQRWERTDRASLPSVAAKGRRVRSGRRPSGRATTRGVTDEFVEPIVLDGRPRLIQRRRGDLLQLPARPGEAALAAPARGGRRPDDDDALPRRLPVPRRLRGAGRREHARRGARRRAARASSTSPRRRSTRTSPTSSTAAWSGVGGGGADPRPLAARRPELRQEAGDVGRRGRRALLRRRSATATASPSSTSRIPTWSGTPGSIPAVIAAVEAADRCLGTVVECVHAAGGVCFVTADHGNAEIMLEPDGVSPHTAHTTSPVPLSSPAADLTLRQEGELSDLAPTMLALLGLAGAV